MNRARAPAHRREGTVDSVTAYSDPLTVTRRQRPCFQHPGRAAAPCRSEEAMART